MNSTHELRGLFVYDMEQMANTALPRIQCPVLTVFGNTGWPYLDKVAKQMEELRMDNLKVIRMKGSHHLHADAPEAFLEAISPFLSEAIGKFKSNIVENNRIVNGNSKL